MSEQTFIQTDPEQSLDIEQFPGAKFFPLAEPVSQGSIHLLTMKAGTTIPIHTHPCDEYVYVMKGVVQTGGKTCSGGIFWFTPAHTHLLQTVFFVLHLHNAKTLNSIPRGKEHVRTDLYSN